MTRGTSLVLLALLLAAPADAAPVLVVLGVAQDGGHPQAGCERACCAPAHADPAAGHRVSCLALVDAERGRRWLFDATPDLPRQLRALDRDHPVHRVGRDPGIAGIFLTHAHVGHYTGLLHLGREVMGASGVPVHAMPRMAEFLAANGPWSQLVTLGNVELHVLGDDVPVDLDSGLRVTPWLVPHRDEYSETVAYRIDGPGASALFVPDIDKWERWDRRLEDVLASVDVAYVDGTFFADGEIPGRAMSEIPHPFVVETMERLRALPESERAKVRFLHLNHTNPALDRTSEAARRVEAAGFGLAVEGEVFSLGRD